jgi:adenylate cyclase
MDNTISDPLAHQRLELEYIRHELEALRRTTVELARRVQDDSAIDLSGTRALIPTLETAIQSVQDHTTTAIQGLEAITIASEARRQEAQHLRTLYTVGQAINSTLDLRSVLNMLIDKVIEVTRAQRGYVVLRDETSGALTVAVARGLSRTSIADESFSVSRSLVTQVATTGEPVVTTNAQIDPRFAEMASVQNYSLRAIMCVPLVIRGQIGGVVYVDNRMRDDLFTKRHLDLLVSIANQAALAIDNARVYDYLTNVLASIASGVISVNQQGSITMLNRAAASIFGLPADQSIGRQYDDVFGLLTGADIPRLVEQVRQQGETVLGYETRAAIPGRGDVVLVFNIARVTAETGESLGVAMVLEDLTQRRRMERFIAPNVVQHLLTSQAAPRPGGELREISVLFGDVQGYTTLSEALEPEALLNLLNAHLALAASSIMDERHGGTLDKYMGDAVMGLFNTPEDQPDHAWRAVSAAWSMQLRLREFQQALPSDQHLRFRVGVHTGRAVVGHLGSENLLNFTAVGDAVNVAKRLQENARPGQIVISEATYRSIAPQQREQMYVRPLALVSLKGRSGDVPAYELLSLEPEPRSASST